nr:TPA_asm: hypothetical protein HUJ06_020324 [Nelumbo nucifera]
MDNELIDTLTKPYSFTKFDNVIGSIRKQYLDTRTQANLSKLNANRRQDPEIVTEDISKILENRRQTEVSERVLVRSRTESPIWCSPCLEVIALKWTPVTIIVVVTIILLWSCIILTDNFVTS